MFTCWMYIYFETLYKLNTLHDRSLPFNRWFKVRYAFTFNFCYQSLLCTICNYLCVFQSFIKIHLIYLIGQHASLIMLIVYPQLFILYINNSTDKCCRILSEPKVTAMSHNLLFFQFLNPVKLLNLEILKHQPFCYSPISITNNSCTSWVCSIQVLITRNIDLIKPFIYSIGCCI